MGAARSYTLRTNTGNPQGPIHGMVWKRPPLSSLERIVCTEGLEWGGLLSIGKQGRMVVNLAV